MVSWKDVINYAVSGNPIPDRRIEKKRRPNGRND